MENLKVSSLTILTLAFLSGCSSSFFKVKAQDELRMELEVSPDRVFAVCEKASDEAEIYMFIVNVLDDHGFVIFVPQSNVLDKETCMERSNGANEIIASGKIITIRGSGDLKPDPRTEVHEVNFPKYGIRKTNQQILPFLSISNERGRCVLQWQADFPPCGLEGFPIK